jgi:cytochrome c5
MIATLNRTVLVALLLLFTSTSSKLVAEPKAKQKTVAESSSVVTNDSYMGLTGEELWSNNCLRCHNIRPPIMYNNAQWDVIVHHMRLRANITGQEQRAIVEFLKAAK